MSTKRSHTASIFDLTSREFDVDAYISYQLKDKTLSELMRSEEEMITAIRRLDSDVHQIVYENYNKFLTATSTVRKIQDEFSGLDTGMEEINSSMGKIQGLLHDLGGTIGGDKSDVTQLSRSYKAVKSVQFIYDLPATLQNYFEEGKFPDLVRIFLLAKKSLAPFSDMEHIAKVLGQCDTIATKAEAELRERISTGQFDNTEQLAKNVELLVSLGVPKDDLQSTLLAASEKSLRDDLAGLEAQVEDVLDLVDRGCGTFLPNLTLFVNLHENLFPAKHAVLLQVVRRLMADFHEIVKRLFLTSTDPKDCSIVVRALDRYYRKMNACSQVLPGLDFGDDCVALINEVSLHQMKISRAKIVEQLELTLKEMRESTLSNDVDWNGMSARLEQVFVFNVKTSLANLLLFTASDVTFSAIPPALFHSKLAVAVHEELLVGAMNDVAEAMATYSSVGDEMRFVSPMLLLTIAMFLHHIAGKSAQYLMRLCEEQFLLVEKKRKDLTHTDTVVAALRDAAQGVIKRFVDAKGLSIGEGVAKAVENNTTNVAPPVGVRSAIRRAVDEVRDFDQLLASILNDGRKEVKASRTPRQTDPFQRDTLWSERVDFHEQIAFTRGSIIAGMVKVFLKVFIEAIRTQTFGKHAVEQIQVDCYYLQRNLAPLVSDEVVVNSLSDMALSSALKRALDPVLLHPNKLMQLCEQNNPAS